MDFLSWEASLKFPESKSGALLLHFQCLVLAPVPTFISGTAVASVCPFSWTMTDWRAGMMSAPSLYLQLLERAWHLVDF